MYTQGSKLSEYYGNAMLDVSARLKGKSENLTGMKVGWESWCLQSFWWLREAEQAPACVWGGPVFQLCFQYKVIDGKGGNLNTWSWSTC